MMKHWLLAAALVAALSTVAMAQAVPLDISGSFNMDAWAGPKEVQECYNDGSQDHKELYGDLEDGNGYWILEPGWQMISNSTSGGFGEAYSISGQWFHPLYVSGTEGTPEDGVLTGAGSREYHIASPSGNDTLSGDWTEVADPSTYAVKSNCVVVGSKHNTADWQISSVTIELPAAQKSKYVDVNFVLSAMNMADLARNMRIVALYGSTGTDEVVLYSFSTADGGSGPKMLDASGGTDFTAVQTMSKIYNSTSGTTGTVTTQTSKLWEFSTALELDSTKDLYGFKLEDVTPSLNWNARGLAVFAASATPAFVPLDISAGFNVDGICGPKEFQECRNDGTQDLIELFGDLVDGNGQWVATSSLFMIADSSGATYAYSISGDTGHPVNYSTTEALPLDGTLTSADSREFMMASVDGNDILSGDWTEVADPSGYTLKDNCVVVGSYHSTASWQISEVTIQLPSNQKAQYDDVNFVLAAMDVADAARNMQIIALYGTSGTDEQVLYSFSTADGGSGPKMTDASAPTDFATLYTMSKAYNSTTGTTGAVTSSTLKLFEFDAPLNLNSSKILYGFKIKDVNPSLNWNRRGLTVFAATAQSSTANQAPTASAGSDQLVHDNDGDGSETVTLDGSASSDADGTIDSYVWKEGTTQIATGQSPQVTLAVGAHTIVLTVTDNDSGTDTDTVVITVNAAPVADAGPDQTVYDDDGGGDEVVALDGGASSDSDGTISSYLWKEGTTQLATTETANVTLAVGTHTITLTVTDNDNGTDSDTVVITVSDNHPPVADAGADQEVEDSDDSGAETVTLDGSGTSDQDGTISSYVWKDSSGTQIATGQSPSVSLNVGINDITLVVTDNDGATDSQVVRIWVYPDVDYWVDGTNGDDSNNGSSGSPWATIDHAADQASAGNVIAVKAGTYRELVSLSVSGSSGSPITLMGLPGERVIISGADLVTGWTQCTQAQAGGNANYANIYYVDISWSPTRVLQGGTELSMARTSGWYTCEGGTTSTLVDTTNLTQADDYWNGATIFLWDTSITAQYERTVTDFVSSTSTITVDSVWNSTVTPESGKDRYYLSNLVELIDGAGQWCVEDQGGGTYRLFVWATGGGDPDNYTMEASRRNRFLIEWGTQSYWVIDNFEIRHGQSHGVGSWSSGGNGHITVQNCIIHDNDGTGIYGRYTDDATYKRNLVYFNGYGIANNGSSNVTIEENEVANNAIDGVLTTGPGGTAWATGVVLRRNYIHHHSKWGHPDNAQSYNNIRGLQIDDNLFLCSVQSYMMEETDQATYTGNVIIGAAAYMVILGHGNTDATTFNNNTLMLANYGLVNQSGDDYTYKNNILVVGHEAPAWSADSTDTYSSDYNLFWHGPDITYKPVTWPNCTTFAEYVTASGEDTHSDYADPKFTNVPAYFVALDSTKQESFTSTKVYMPSSETTYFAVGDKVEIDFDGTVRTVQTVGTDYITFTPGDAYIAQKASMVVNWVANTDFNIDLTLRAGSPATGAGDTGGDLGSSINVQQYMAGDFNGDGRRDIPNYPN